MKVYSKEDTRALGNHDPNIALNAASTSSNSSISCFHGRSTNGVRDSVDRALLKTLLHWMGVAKDLVKFFKGSILGLDYNDCQLSAKVLLEMNVLPKKK